MFDNSHVAVWPISVVGLQWLGLFGYWLVSAIGVKRPVRGKEFWRSLLLSRLILVAVIVAAVKAPQPWHDLLHAPIVRPNLSNQLAGLALCTAGLSFAVWARFQLGRNWGMPMDVHEDAELVTAGPYHLVRHPIYSGMLLGLFGSWLAGGMGFPLIFIAIGAYFIYAASQEEKQMVQHFPNDYPAYRKRTKMVIPFLL